MHNYIHEAITQHGLPAHFEATVKQWYRLLAEKIAQRQSANTKTLVLGIQGSQGSGKSTLADFLRLLLAHEYKLNCAILSIDDFYLTRAERHALSESTHPLLMTRGVPGTHDVALAISTIQQLCTLGKNERCTPVRFNKAIDDREAEAQWPSVSGPIDIVILEGWCVGLSAQADHELNTPINVLEQTEDKNGQWRRFVNGQLSGHYSALFELLDCLAVLKAPSFNSVFQWRLLQEQKLEQHWLQLPAAQRVHSKILNPSEIERFISHYQRLTEHGLRTLPTTADWLLPLGDDHQILNLTSKANR